MWGGNKENYKGENKKDSDKIVAFSDHLITYSRLFYICEEMSKMMLISKKFCIDVTPTAICTDFKKFGKCYIKELRNLLHPRLAFFKLNRKLDENNNNEQDESIDANVVPAQILNRFKNSTFFSAKDSLILIWYQES